MSLAAIKRRMQPGAKAQVIRHDWNETNPPKLRAKPGFFDVREVIKAGATQIQFSGGSWLTWPKSSCIRETATGFEVCLNDDGTFREVIAYEYRDA